VVVGGFEELDGGRGAGGSETRLGSPRESIDGCEETASTSTCFRTINLVTAFLTGDKSLVTSFGNAGTGGAGAESFALTFTSLRIDETDCVWVGADGATPSWLFDRPAAALIRAPALAFAAIFEAAVADLEDVADEADTLLCRSPIGTVSEGPPFTFVPALRGPFPLLFRLVLDTLDRADVVLTRGDGAADAEVDGAVR
jgi:hypothetical protein